MFGIVTFVKPEQPRNARSLIEFTEFGIVTLVKPELKNASAAIEVTV